MELLFVDDLAAMEKVIVITKVISMPDILYINCFEPFYELAIFPFMHACMSFKPTISLSRSVYVPSPALVNIDMQMIIKYLLILTI